MSAPAAPPPLPSGPEAPSAAPPFVRELDTLVRARYPLVYLVSWEEQRLDGILAELARAHGKTLFTWSITRGMRREGSGRGPAPEARDPVEAITAIEKLADPALVVLKDFHPFLNDPSVIRAMRELAHALKSTYTTVILLSPTLTIPT